jgi:hypothetical protein
MAHSMSHSKEQLRQMAHARWDYEGGAGPDGPQEGTARLEILPDFPPLTNTELVLLRVRVIALENLVISLLAQASDRQLDHAREMAGYISPRSGVTHHALILHAAAHMVDLVERAQHFRTKSDE